MNLKDDSKVYALAHLTCSTGHQIKGLGELLIGSALRVAPTGKDLRLEDRLRDIANDLDDAAADLRQLADHVAQALDEQRREEQLVADAEEPK